MVQEVVNSNPAGLEMSVSRALVKDTRTLVMLLYFKISKIMETYYTVHVQKIQ
jgi:hypothetical protein